MMTAEEYKARLKERPIPQLTVSSVGEYIQAIIAINSIYKRALFRGQADKEWKIKSYAYREIEDKSKIAPTQKILHDYHRNLIAEARHLKDTDEHADMTFLAHMQHNGARTCFIDYSRNPLISLWFACISEEQADGSVYCIENSNRINDLFTIDGDTTIDTLFAQSNTVNVFIPPNINRRIISQQSVFLISARGFIDKSAHISLIIPQNCKNEIVEQLALVGISRKTLFPDFHGFTEWFSFDSEMQRDQYEGILQKAKRLYTEYRCEEAISALNAGEDAGKELFGENSEEMAALYNDKGLVYVRMGNYNEAAHWHQEAYDIQIKLLGAEHLDMAATYNNLGEVCVYQGDYAKALEWHQKALRIRETVLSKEHSDTATTFYNIACLYLRQGDDPTALEWYQKALSIREKVLGKEHPDTASSYNDIALVYSHQGDNSKAMEWYQKALVICETVLGKDHPETATAYNNIAGVYYSRGDYSKALEWYQKALAIREKMLVEEHPDTAMTYNNIATVYDSQCDYSTAMEWYQKSLMIKEKVLGKEHPSSATTYNNIAHMYNNQEDYPNALGWFQKALDIYDKRLGHDHPYTKAVRVSMEFARTRLRAAEQQDTPDTEPLQDPARP